MGGRRVTTKNFRSKECTKYFVRKHKSVGRLSPATRNPVSSATNTDERIGSTDDKPDLGHMAGNLCKKHEII